MKLRFLWPFFFLNISKSLYANSDVCAFCSPKVLQAQSVFESRYFSVLLDHAPAVKGHLLVVPKRHIVKAHEMLSEEWEELSVVIPKIVMVFSKFLGTDQYIILEKNGPHAFQCVPHVHFHLFPVTAHKWSQIFGALMRKQLNKEALLQETNTFRDYFSKQ